MLKRLKGLLKGPTIEEKRELVAKVFWLDCRHDPDYPHKTWREQFDEMVVGEAVSEGFLQFVWENNRGRNIDREFAKAGLSV